MAQPTLAVPQCQWNRRSALHQRSCQIRYEIPNPSRFATVTSFEHPTSGRRRLQPSRATTKSPSSLEQSTCSPFSMANADYGDDLNANLSPTISPISHPRFSVLTIYAAIWKIVSWRPSPVTCPKPNVSQFRRN